MKDLISRFFVLLILSLTSTNLAICRTNADDALESTTSQKCITINDEFDADSLCIEFIIEKDNQAVPGAEVQIEGIGEIFKSFGSGRIIINNLEKGTYTYSVNAKGYVSYISKIELKDGSVKQKINLSKK